MRGLPEKGWGIEREYTVYGFSTSFSSVVACTKYEGFRYRIEYDFKRHYNTIALGHLLN